MSSISITEYNSSSDPYTNRPPPLSATLAIQIPLISPLPQPLGSSSFSRVLLFNNTHFYSRDLILNWNQSVEILQIETNSLSSLVFTTYNQDMILFPLFYPSTFRAYQK